MKKFGFGFVAMVATVGMTVVGCNSNLAETSVTKTTPVELGVVGIQHNAILTDFYQLNNEGRSATTGLTEEDVEAYFGDYETVVSTSYGDTEAIVSSLVSEANVSEAVAPFVQQIEDLLENADGTLESTITAIVAIEEKASSALTEDLFAEFETYADTAKASLVFWTENYELLSGTRSARASSSNVSVWQRIAMAAVSDAAGAIAGYQEGVNRGYSGSTLVAYVATCAAASSASGFASAEVKVLTV